MNVDWLSEVVSLPGQEFPVRLTTALLHFLWQGCLIGVIAAALSRGLRRRSARLRYAVNVAALLILAVCLPATYFLVDVPEADEIPVVASSMRDAPAVLIADEASDEAPTEVTNDGALEAVAPAAESIETQTPHAEVNPAAIEPPTVSSTVSLTRRLEAVAPWATAAYLVGVIVMTLRMLVALCGGHRLRAAAVPIADPALLEIARRQAREIGLRFTPTIAWCGRVSTPIVVGILKPAILLPGALATGLTPEQFGVLLTHELAHVRRYDLILNLLQRAIEAVLFFHPAVWSISHRISREREHCCDDFVITSGCPRTEYAEALVRMAELCLAGRPRVSELATLGLAGESRSEFRQRVLRILSAGEPSPVRLSRSGLIVMVAALGLTALSPALWQPDVLAQRDREEQADPQAAAEAPQSEPDAPAVESTIEVSLKLDRTEYLLGESIAVDYEMKNVGIAPAPYARGAIYPTLRLNDAYRMTAIPVDENGSPIGEAVPQWPKPQDFGGAYSLRPPTIDPGDRRVDTLFVTRYLRFDEPGRYRLTVENVGNHFNGTIVSGHFSGTALSAGETIITLKQPTPEQARQVYEAKKLAPREAYRDGPMKFVAGAADFETMHQPVYLEVLRHFAEQNDPDALPSLERMQNVEANSALVDQISRSTDESNWDFARACFGHLKPSLPFPNWYDDVNSKWDQENRERVERTWRDEFAPTLVRLARGLTAELVAADDNPGEVPADDQEAWQAQLSDIDYIYRCLGQPEDLADCMRAYAISIELTRTLPFETHQYFRPRGSAFGFMHAVIRMMGRGARPPVAPAHPGEAATYLLALRTQPDFRPDGSSEELVKWFRYGIDNDLPYLSELVLDDVPAPVPQALLDAVPEALAHPYVDLQIAACKLAERYPRPEFREPLRRVLASAQEEYLVKYATLAGVANGIQSEPPRGAASELTLPDHLNVMAAAFTEDDATLVSVATESDVSVRFWDRAAEPAQTVKLDTEIHGNRFLNGTLQLSENGALVAAAINGKFEVWDARSGQIKRTLLAPPGMRVAAAALSPDGSLAAGAGEVATGLPRPDGPVYVWDVATGEVKRQLSHAGARRIHALTISADGRLLASASQEFGTLVWDLENGELLQHLKNDNTGREHPAGPLDQSAANQVLSVAFSPDRSILATGDMYGVKLWGVATGQMFRWISAPYRYGRSRVLFSPDGTRVARAEADDTVIVWDVETGARLFELATDSNCAAFSQDGRRLAVGFTDDKQALKVFTLAE